MNYTEKQVREFIKESNEIENVHEEEAIDESYDAWLWLDCYSKESITLVDILITHKIILERLDPKLAGKLRSEIGYDVQVGGRVCPRYYTVAAQLCDWVKGVKEFTNDKKLKWDEVSLQASHVKFEHIHPFGDGNGRVGRLLWLKMRQSAELGFKLIKFSERQEYYKWFK